jgi:hypothetical protein
VSHSSRGFRNSHINLTSPEGRSPPDACRAVRSKHYSRSIEHCSTEKYRSKKIPLEHQVMLRATWRRIPQHSKITSVAFENNICNIQNQHLQQRININNIEKIPPEHQVMLHVTWRKISTTFKKEHLQHSKTTHATSRIKCCEESTSATLKHLDLLLQHLHETSKTRGACAYNMHQNLSAARHGCRPKLLWWLAWWAAARGRPPADELRLGAPRAATRRWDLPPTRLG